MSSQNIMKSCGSSSVDAPEHRAIVGGRQGNHRTTEYFPLSAQEVVAGESKVKPISGFHLYNADDQVHTTNIASWVGRWLESKKASSWNSTCLFIDTIDKPWAIPTWLRAAIILVSVAFMVRCGALSFATQDWVGFAGVIAVASSMLARAARLDADRTTLIDNLAHIHNENWAWDMKTILLIMPDGEAVTVFAPIGLVTEAILAIPNMAYATRYRLCRYFDWACFGLYVVTLGLSSLTSQLLSMCLVLTNMFFAPSLRLSGKDFVGSHIRIRRFDDVDAGDQRMQTYARLVMTPNQEQALIAWGLMPQVIETAWWTSYGSLKTTMDNSKFLAWKNWCLASSSRPPTSGNRKE